MRDKELTRVAGFVLVLLMGACSWTNIDNNNQQAQGITQSTPLASPSPGAECSLSSLMPGTAGDVREIAAGGSVAIGVSLFGPQGLPLVPSCLSQYTPVWTSLSGPCTFVGSHDGLATAPADATVGATCQGSVQVATLNARLGLVVTE